MSRVSLIQFTDILCVWAYACQVRVDHLLEEQPAGVELDPRFCGVFGDARARLERRWRDRGGLAGYAAHVREVCDQFDHVAVHEDTWARVAPLSSLHAHVFLAAIRHLEGEPQIPEGAFASACWAFREAFFRDARDIGTRAVHYEIAEELGLPIAAIETCLGTGAAHADLQRDFDLARQYDVTVSPTLVINEGRQRLSGNVGYRVIAANVRELLRFPGPDDASWC